MLPITYMQLQQSHLLQSNLHPAISLKRHHPKRFSLIISLHRIDKGDKGVKAPNPGRLITSLKLSEILAPLKSKGASHWPQWEQAAGSLLRKQWLCWPKKELQSQLLYVAAKNTNLRVIRATLSLPFKKRLSISFSRIFNHECKFVKCHLWPPKLLLITCKSIVLHYTHSGYKTVKSRIS